MGRLIDSDFIKEGIEYILNDSKELVTSSVVRNAMIALVDRAKTVDAVEVVRCGQCKFFRTAKCTSRDDGWYCADGERTEQRDE